MHIVKQAIMWEDVSDGNEFDSDDDDSIIDQL